MVTTSSGLVDIRAALVALLDPRLRELGAVRIDYQADVQEGPSAADVVARVTFGLPRRETVGWNGEPQVHQAGQIIVDWLFPSTHGEAAMQAAVNGTAALLVEQALPGDAYLSGDVSMSRAGSERLSDAPGAPTGSRVVWRVMATWDSYRFERYEGGAGVPVPTSDAAAVLAVRNVWASRIEAFADLEGWAGLRTYWDHLPENLGSDLPAAAYSIAVHDLQAVELHGTTTVQGRALVQLFTAPQGIVPTLRIIERILAEHNRTTMGVLLGPVDLEAQNRTSAATLQTNLRIPFTYQRAR